MKIHNFEQQTDEWFAIRKGKMSASHAQAIGNCSTGLTTYIITLMSEFYSSGERDYYTNKDMERGNELEEYAREIYELEKNVTVNQIGFAEYNKYAGCSPDGLVDDDGLIEIKCMNDFNHFKTILGGKKKISSSYIWQMQMQMLITGRSWCDFVAYNPNFKKSLLIERIEIDEEKQDKLIDGINIGIKMIREINKEFLNDRISRK